MNCAKRCKKGFLLIEQHEGVTVMQCHWCKGVWLDRNDIEDIEDLEFSEKWLKSSFKVTKKDTKWVCHHCGYKLKEVKYFEEGVKVGFCPEGHGWWFDNGKKAKLEKFFKLREEALKKKMKTKKSWKEYLRGLKSGEFINKVSGKKPPWWDDPEEGKGEKKTKKEKGITKTQKKKKAQKKTSTKAQKGKAVQKKSATKSEKAKGAKRKSKPKKSLKASKKAGVKTKAKPVKRKRGRPKGSKNKKK